MSENYTYYRVNKDGRVISYWEGDETGPFNPAVRKDWLKHGPEHFEVESPSSSNEAAPPYDAATATGMYDYD